MTETDPSLPSRKIISLGHKPNEDVVQRAEAIAEAHSRMRRLGGYLARLAVKSESKVAKNALIVPAALEIALELPILIPAIVHMRLQSRRFVNAMVADYPQLYDIDLNSMDYRTTLKGGSVESYANAVLQYGSAGNSNQSIPPGANSDISMPAPSQAESIPPNHLTPIVAI